MLYPTSVSVMVLIFIGILNLKVRSWKNSCYLKVWHLVYCATAQIFNSSFCRTFLNNILFYLIEKRHFIGEKNYKFLNLQGSYIFTCFKSYYICFSIEQNWPLTFFFFYKSCLTHPVECFENKRWIKI